MNLHPLVPSHMSSSQIGNSQTPVWQIALSQFAFICAVLASLAVLLNDIYYVSQDQYVLTALLWLLGFIFAFLSAPKGLMAMLFCLPLVANLHRYIEIISPNTIVAIPMPGIDLVAGFFYGWILNSWLRKKDAPFSSITQFIPWQVGLIPVLITVSTLLSIARNLRMSAASTSLDGLIFNVIHFRPIYWDRRPDFLPIGDWIAYCLAAALCGMVIRTLFNCNYDRWNSILFRPLIAGLFMSACIGILQSITGLGLPAELLSFRKDALGYAAFGMQPDLHAYAAHMLLGVLGLWGYFFICKSKTEKYLILVTVGLSILGLIASKSRASLIFGLLGIILLFFIFIYFRYRPLFRVLSLVTFSFLLLALAGFWIFLQGGGNLAGLQWVNELYTESQKMNWSSLSDLTGLFGSRLEIWSAALNMGGTFPLLGIGQGDFFRLSSIISFSRSYFLEHNGGENAHNYFLQTFAETGLVGIGIFLFIFLWPWFHAEKKGILIPAGVALASLIIGNIFGHAFLVRELLLIGAALMGLIYALSLHSNPPIYQQVHEHMRTKRWLKIGLALIAVLALLEAISSFYRKPFGWGTDCFVRQEISQDGWTSGLWEERMVPGQTQIRLEASPLRPNLIKKPVQGILEILVWEPGKGKIPIAEQTLNWTSNQTQTFNLVIPAQYQSIPQVITARLTLSSCYTPRNLGINTDERRLGLKVENVRID